MQSSLLREGLACLLAQHPEIEVVGQGGTAAQASRAVDRHTPDVLLANAQLLAEGGGARPRAADRELPARTVALVEEGRGQGLRHLVFDLLDRGVAALVSKSDDAKTVVEAVQAASREGEVFVSPRVAARLALAVGHDGEPGAVPTAADSLTRREREVLSRAALGHTNVRIAEDLGLASGTVRNHLSSVYTKLGVRARAEAVAWAWRFGLAHAAGASAEHQRGIKMKPEES